MTYAIPATIIGALILLAMCVRHVWRKSEITDRNEQKEMLDNALRDGWMP